MSVCSQAGSPCDHYPWCHWSVTGHMGPQDMYKHVHLGTSHGSGSPRPVQPCSLCSSDICQLAGGWHSIQMPSCYRPQTKFAKVMFLQVSVCPHWGGMRGFIQGCVVLFGGHAWFYSGGGHAWFYLGGGHAWFYWGACVVLFGGVCVVLFGGHEWFYSGGVHGFYSEGCAWFYLGGVCGFIWGACVVLFGGACVVFSVFSDTMRYSQWAGGTHPTGMHSCFGIKFRKSSHVVWGQTQRHLSHLA